MSKFKKKKLQYSHTRWGDTLKVEIRDQNRTLLYKNKLNIHDKKSILSLLDILEKYGNFNIIEIIEAKTELGRGWW